MTLANWFRLWIGLCFTFAAMALYNLFAGDNPFWQAGCFILQCSCGIYWMSRLAKEKKRDHQMIKDVDVNKLVQLLHNQKWHEKAEIIPAYIPKGQRDKENPEQYAFIAVRYNDGTEYPPFLRKMGDEGAFKSPNSGVTNGLFWDVYGDGFESIEEAIIAIAKAPEPVDVNPVTFSFKW